MTQPGPMFGPSPEPVPFLAAELISHGEARTLPLAPFDPRWYVGAAHTPTRLEPFQGTAATPC